MADPNDPNVPLDPDEPQPQQQPEPEPPAPQIDLDQAYDVIAQKEGWDPRLTRYEIQEHKRRVQEFERQRQEFEREKSRRYEPPEDNGDPYMREIRDTRRELREFIEAQRTEKQNQERTNRLMSEVDSVYVAHARQAGMTKEQMQSQVEEFYAAMNDLYPEPQMLEAIGVERAARNAFQMINNRGPQRQAQQRNDPRAQIVIPTQGTGPTTSPAPVGPDFGAQRQGESTEQYHQRLKRSFQESGFTASGIMPDKGRISSG